MGQGSLDPYARGEDRLMSALHPLETTESVEHDDVENAEMDYLRVRLVVEGDEISRIILIDADDIETEWVKAPSTPMHVEKTA
jgi:hypothetical protein